MKDKIKTNSCVKEQTLGGGSSLLSSPFFVLIFFIFILRKTNNNCVTCRQCGSCQCSRARLTGSVQHVLLLQHVFTLQSTVSAAKHIFVLFTFSSTEMPLLSHIMDNPVQNLVCVFPKKSKLKRGQTAGKTPFPRSVLSHRSLY